MKERKNINEKISYALGYLLATIMLLSVASVFVALSIKFIGWLF